MATRHGDLMVPHNSSPEPRGFGKETGTRQSAQTPALTGGSAMADIVLGMATSHTPMLSLTADLWSSYAGRDMGNPELAFPPHGQVMSYERALAELPSELQ